MGFAVLFVALQFLVWQLPCNAQSFTWQFADTASTSISTCDSLPITFQNNAGTKAVPPYYMTALEAGGISTTTLVENNSWKVNHAEGSQLVLNVIDSTGKSGGISATVYDVVAGTSKSCLSSAPGGSDFKLTANVTKDLDTCEPWGLRIVGGVEPYNLTIAALGAPSSTNVTIDLGMDLFTYINRASPDGQLIAAVSDSTGKWASGAVLVKTQGSADTTCAGLASSSGSSGSSSSASSAGASSSVISKPGSTSSTSVTSALASSATTSSIPSATPSSAAVALGWSSPATLVGLLSAFYLL
ncbi:hypothetical protein C8J56DRAFT_1024536 [Mycena floridula]|nr:hypothetical protein C8J56DRAFT_1024536 [Mycena floridula]